MYWAFLVGMLVLFSILLGPSIWRMSRRSAAVKRHANAVMIGREHLTPQQFAERFFPTWQHAIAASVHEVLAEVLIVDAARVWPDDKLVGDLGLGRVDGLDAHHLDMDLQASFGISILGVFERGDPSVREVIEFICRQLSPNQMMDPSGNGGRVS